MLHIDMNAFFLSLAVEIQVTVIVTLIIGGHPFYLFKRRDALMLLLNSPPPNYLYQGSCWDEFFRYPKCRCWFILDTSDFIRHHFPMMPHSLIFMQFLDNVFNLKNALAVSTEYKKKNIAKRFSFCNFITSS